MPAPPPAPGPEGTCKMTLGRRNNPIDEITNYHETRNFLFEEQMWGWAAAIYNQLPNLINIFVYCCYQTFIWSIQFFVHKQIKN